jgi:CubicO group peptidase (beta-lactamase class C family)
VDAEDVTPDAVFMVASVSKLFAGAAVLKLVSEGSITLDDDICDVLPNDHVITECRNPYWPETIVTWRMLVTHTSSLTQSIPLFNGTEASYGPTGGYIDGAAAGNVFCPLTDVQGTGISKTNVKCSRHLNSLL